MAPNQSLCMLNEICMLKMLLGFWSENSVFERHETTTGHEALLSSNRACSPHLLSFAVLREVTQLLHASVSLLLNPE